MKTFTIIGGVNGTGKSSLTGVLKAQTTDLGQIIDVDIITAENGGSAIQSGKIALERIRACLNKGISFAQETTLSNSKTELTAKEAQERGYSVRLFYVGLDSVEECLQRIENRVAHGGHDNAGKMCCGVLPAAGRMWRMFCLIVTRRTSSTTITALLK